MHWQTLTYFGDSMLLLPTALLLTLVIFVNTESWRPTAAWLLAFGGTGLVVSLSKILFLGFFIGSARYNFTGFSGHTAMASVFWPSFLWVLSAERSLAWRQLALLTGYSLPLAVGYSRLELNAHSASEVICGVILGFSFSTAFLWSQRHTRLRRLRAWYYALLLALPLLIFKQGQPATTQQFLAKLAAQLAGVEQPYSRDQLLRSLR